MGLFGLFGPPNVKKMKASKDVQGLINALGYDKNRDVCASASQALIEIGEPAVELLAKALRHTDASIRRRVVRTLAGIRSDQAKESLLQMLKDDSSGVREEVVKAIGGYQDKKLSSYLVNVLDDESENVRKEAALALDKISWEPIDAKERVHYLIAKEEWAEIVPLGDAAVEPLIKALDTSVSQKAAIVLGRIGDLRAVPKLVKLAGRHILMAVGLNKRLGVNIVQSYSPALILMGEPAIAPLIQALGADDSETKAGAICTLMDIGQPVVAPLKQALNTFPVSEQFKKSATAVLEGIAQKDNSESD
jgi:HEAT repeat protein